MKIEEDAYERMLAEMFSAPVPEDVIKTAWDMYQARTDLDGAPELMMAAIMAERERCARLCEIFPFTGRTIAEIESAAKEGKAIAAAIRKGEA